MSIKRFVSRIGKFGSKKIASFKIKTIERAQRKSVAKKLSKLNQPELSEQEKKEITDFWGKYGIDIKDFNSFRWYYGISGIKDPRFIPQDIQYNILLPYYNTQKYNGVYGNKTLFDRFMPADIFPETIAKRINGDFYDSRERFIDKETLVSLLSGYEEIIIKNAVETGQGKNVDRIALQSERDILLALEKWESKNDYVIQKVVRQHPFFAQFNSSSVNIIRFNSFFHEGKVMIHTPVLRFGLPGHATDVAYVNGEETVQLVGITDTGRIRDQIVYYDGRKKKLTDIVKDPIMQVPSWDAILDIIRTQAAKMPYYKLLGWDVTVNEDGKPVVIEYNIKFPSPYSSQVTDGPMWANDTEVLLSFLTDAETQKKAIPSIYRKR